MRVCQKVGVDQLSYGMHVRAVVSSVVSGCVAAHRLKFEAPGRSDVCWSKPDWLTIPGRQLCVGGVHITLR